MTMQSDVDRLVSAVIPHVEEGKGTLAQRVHAYLWPLVAVATEAAAAAGAVPATEPAAPEPKDRRVRLWQCTVHFWRMTENGPELVAETDPEIIEGTGTLSALVEQYGLDLHGLSVPELHRDAIKAQLPQLRNNLGRRGSAVLRVEYSLGAESWLCQVDVIRLES